MEFRIGDFVTGINSRGKVCCIGLVKEHSEKEYLLTYALLDLETNQVEQRGLRFSKGNVRLSTDDERKLFLDKLIKVVD